MSFMEEQVLGYKSPLYGRRTSQFKINPFNYLESAEFVPKYSYKDKAIVYALTNGIAEYLTYFDENKSLKDNIINNFLKANGRLYDEANNLLKQELRRPKTYNDILYSISKGASKLNEISNKINLASGSLSYYLNALISLGIIERKTPVLNRKTKRPVYKIKDTMYLFWYKFVQPNLNIINLGMSDSVYKNSVETNINNYMGEVFEKISIEYFEELIKRKGLEFFPEDYGNWWGNDKRLKMKSEIDLLAYDKSKNYLFLEAKWRNEPVKENVLEGLIEKSLNFNFLKANYMITSLSGYKIKQIYDNVRLIELEDMYFKNK